MSDLFKTRKHTYTYTHTYIHTQGSVDRNEDILLSNTCQSEANALDITSTRWLLPI